MDSTAHGSSGVEPTSSEPRTSLEEAAAHAYADLEVEHLFARERDEALRTMRALVFGPVLGCACWLILLAAAYLVVKILL